MTNAIPPLSTLIRDAAILERLLRHVPCEFHVPLQAAGVGPGAKPRPALIVSVETRDDGDILRVAYGTSKNVTRLKAREFAITQAKHATAYELAGLAYDTKCDFTKAIDLPWSDRYFKAPLRNRNGNTPKIGTLHATVLHAAHAAYKTAM